MSRYSMRSCDVEDRGEGRRGVKVRFGERPRGLALTLVVGGHRGERFDRLVERGEAEQAFSTREEGARAGVLDDRGLARGEVAQRPVADPRVLERHARRFRAAELTAR